MFSSAQLRKLVPIRPKNARRAVAGHLETCLGLVASGIIYQTQLARGATFRIRIGPLPGSWAVMHAQRDAAQPSDPTSPRFSE